MPPSPDTSLRFLKGVGPARGAALAGAGLETAWDLLHAVPRCLGAPPPLLEQGPLPRGAEVRLRARVLQARPTFGRGRGLGIEAALERADGYALRARFFNAGYLRRHLVPGEWFLWEGRTDPKQAGVLLHPAFTHLPGGAAQDLPAEAPCRVAYRLPEGVSERAMGQLVDAVLEEHLAGVTDPAGALDPAAYQAALRALHRPASELEHERARRVLAARELLALAWRLQARRRDQVERPGRAWRWSDDIHQRALARLPFAPTPGQEAALAEVRADLREPRPMFRLLQGDVGSGKTALALIASLAVIADGAQTLWFAPTAVLARQHAEFCSRCLGAGDGRPASRVRIGLLTGGTAPAERERLLLDLAERRLELLIGTHALLEEDVRVAELGLVVIDEQHKFGVEQRATLVNRAAAQQGWRPDLLLMTATPIPRTLALTAFGDLAVSRIAGKPPGRGAVATALAPFAGLEQLDAPLREALAAGGQAYVICPLREESGKVDAADAGSVHRRLARALGEARVGLLHGALAEADKLALVARFAAGGLEVLVSTTVVEVGIDVARANLLVVLDAERFGLAQLHQLRGRIGRGALPGRCLLFHRAEEQPDRLRALVEHDDGLAIAEADLASRGPGQLLGTGQHGALALRIADLARDLDLLQDAHVEARRRLAAGEAMPERLERFLERGVGMELLSGG
jgi:ATP-dependent DNA helicase RecG